MQDNSCCNEYQQYKNSVAKGDLYLKFYYCGQNKYGVGVYDVEKMSEDGFILDWEPPDEPEHLPSTVCDKSYIFNFDDENPDYIRGSIEEM